MIDSDVADRLEDLVVRISELEKDRDDFRDRVDELEREKNRVEQQNKRLWQFVSNLERELKRRPSLHEFAELERELDRRTVVRWESEDSSPKDIFVESPDPEAPSFSLGEAVVSKAPAWKLDELLEEVEKLKRKGVDPEDIAGLAGDTEIVLPIEDEVAKLRSDIREDPSANKLRATVVFRAFGGRARSRNGKLKLASADVSNILAEKAGISDPNSNTIRRTMFQVAKLTSSKPPDEREPRDPENLITVEKGRSGNELVADRDEWKDYLDEVEDRYR